MIKHRIIYLIGSFITILFISITVFFIAIVLKKTSNPKAETTDSYVITVHKTPTISIYVSGIGVNQIDSTTTIDTYEVTKGTIVAFRAVNESKIFTGWNFVPTIDDINPTDSYVVFTPTSDLVVDVSRRDPLKTDFGKYIQNSFIIDTDISLIQLKDIFETGTEITKITDEIVTYYNTFFKEDEEYISYKGDMKKGIIDTFFSKLQNGYFVVTTSFTIFESNYVGIGNETYPFKGVICGLNGKDISNIFINTICTETSGNNYCGLFGVTEEEAVIRNLNVNTSISFLIDNMSQAENIYAGGIAGIIKGSYLYHLNISTKASIDEIKTANIYLGGIAGKIEGGTKNSTFGLNDKNDVVCKLNDCTWIIGNQSQSACIMAGGVAGYGKNTYIKDIKIDISNYIVKSRSISSNVYDAKNNTYIGNVFGYYVNDTPVEIKNVEIYGSTSENLTAIISSGNAYVSGLIGYVNSQKTLELGYIKFDIGSGENTILAQSLDAASCANLYTGGLIAKIDDSAIHFIVATQEFKNRIHVIEVDGEEKYEYDAIFSGNYHIKSNQNGISDGINFGKAVAGGLVGYGYIHMNGTSNEPSNIIISIDDFDFIVHATQSITSTTSQDGKTNDVINDKEHCIAGLIYGLFSVNVKQIKVENINYFASRFSVTTTREMNSKTGGDLHTGGLAGYSYAVDYENITVLFDHSTIQTQAYSYDGIWTDKTHIEDANNAYTGGFIGEFSGQKNGIKASMKNVKVIGYDYNKHNVVGTTLKLTSIQNTTPPGEDYSAENYIGGVIGRLYNADVSGITYNGSGNSESYINMQSNENPDTSFCGGIIGYIKNNENDSALSVNIEDCLIQNAVIKGFTTCVTAVAIPDMYCGGIIGACFNGGANSSSLTIKNCRTYNTDILSVGNEIQKVYAAGIIGINTWAGTTTIRDCYVYGCDIKSYAYFANIESTTTSTYAAGIIAETTTDTNINNCCTIDTNIFSQNNNPLGTDAIVAGIVAINQRTLKIMNCYSSASLKVSGSAQNNNYYGIAPTNTILTNSKSYYIQELAGANAQYNNFIPLTVASRKIDNGEYGIFNQITGSDKYRNKYYPILIDNKFIVNNLDMDGKEITISKKLDNVTDVLKIWINVKENGSIQNPTEYANDFERHEAGWFLIANILLETGSSPIDEEENISIENITYILENMEYEYNQEKNLFMNLNYPYDAKDYIGYKENRDSQTVDFDGEIKNILASFEIKLHDYIPDLRITFRIKNGDQEVSNYYPSFFNSDGELIYSFNTTTEYGKYKYNKSTDGNDAIYEFYFTPNKELIESAKFYLGFKIGSSDNYKYSENVFEFTLKANKMNLVGFKYAEYTIPVNYYDSFELGSKDNPWLIYLNSAIKIIPIFTKENDQLINGEKPLYDSEVNIEKVDYTITVEEYTSGTINTIPLAVINSSGELKCGSKTTTPNINNFVTITLKDDKTQSIHIYFQIVDIYEVSYSSIGADVWGLLFTNDNNNYKLDMDINNGYCGEVEHFDITIGTIQYNMDDVMIKGWIKDENGNTLTSWNNDIEKYMLLIPSQYITNHIHIDIEFKTAYMIIFDSQSQSFNPETMDDHIKKYKVTSGTSFNEFFNQNLLNRDLYPWINSKGIFGYVFMGFYLIDSASSIVSYGVSLDDILSKTELMINSSYTFYARWSFLIEIIEAPGTHIQTSFSKDFLNDYGVDKNGNELTQEELAKLNISRAVTIPINNNQGYIFTIEKDKDFIGKANVQVFICHKNGDEKVLTEIPIEKYHEEMYLYKIPAEVITGYLVISTSVSSSELIVGENTSQVMDNILPEDGVYTFKYIANHFNKTDTVSYIYNSGIIDNPNYNLELNRNILLRFYQEIYDLTTHQTKLIEKKLIEGTIIEVYYHQYKNGEYIQEEDIVGTYTVKGDCHQIVLSDFLKLNLNEKAFPEILFKDLLNGTESLSEIYYFVITPPNGYTEYEDGYGSIVNNYIYVGYYDENKADDDNPFVSGARADHDLVNLPLEEEIGEFMTYESSCHIRSYSVIPSRVTSLEKVENNPSEYVFRDIDYYSIFDLMVSKENLLSSGIIVLNNSEYVTNTIVESSIIHDGILELNLSLGFNYGTVDVYGRTKDGQWEWVQSVYVDSYEYKNYFVSFDASKNYMYFKLNNVSQNEIRMNGISFSTITNGIIYEFTQEDIQNATTSQIEEITTIHMGKDICGDTRHEGKHFVMSIQFKDSNGNIVEDIKDATITIDGKQYQPHHKENSSAVVYYDLTTILNELSLNEIQIIINCPTGYILSCVELLETVSIQKPAMSEVRYIYNI